MKALITRIKRFFSQAKSELKKLTRPSSHDFLVNLRTVVVCCVLMALLVAALDLVFTHIYDAVLNLIALI